MHVGPRYKNYCKPVSLLEEDAEHELIKEEDPFVVDLEKMKKWRKHMVPAKEANLC